MESSQIMLVESLTFLYLAFILNNFYSLRVCVQQHRGKNPYDVGQLFAEATALRSCVLYCVSILFDGKMNQEEKNEKEKKVFLDVYTRFRMQEEKTAVGFESTSQVAGAERMKKMERQHSRPPVGAQTWKKTFHLSSHVKRKPSSELYINFVVFMLYKRIHIQYHSCYRLLFYIDCAVSSFFCFCSGDVDLHYYIFSGWQILLP